MGREVPIAVANKFWNQPSPPPSPNLSFPPPPHHTRPSDVAAPPKHKHPTASPATAANQALSQPNESCIDSVSLKPSIDSLASAASFSLATSLHLRLPHFQLP